MRWSTSSMQHRPQTGILLVCLCACKQVGKYVLSQDMLLLCICRTCDVGKSICAERAVQKQVILVRRVKPDFKTCLSSTLSHSKNRLHGLRNTWQCYSGLDMKGHPYVVCQGVFACKQWQCKPWYRIPSPSLRRFLQFFSAILWFEVCREAWTRMAICLEVNASCYAEKGHKWCEASRSGHACVQKRAVGVLAEFGFNSTFQTAFNEEMWLECRGPGCGWLGRQWPSAASASLLHPVFVRCGFLLESGESHTRRFVLDVGTWKLPLQTRHDNLKQMCNSAGLLLMMCFQCVTVCP
jgi:hypothetical protein